MMAEMLLRVVVVALALLVFPRDDPEVTEWEDTVTTKYTEHEERLLKGEEELLFKTTPVTDQRPPDVLENIPDEEKQESDQDFTEKDETIYQNITEKDTDKEVDHRPPEKHSINKPVSSLTVKHEEPETETKTSQIIHQQTENHTSTNISAEEPGRPQDEDKKPEEMKTSHSEQQDSPPLQLQTKISENKTSEKPDLQREMDFFWYMWNAFSVLSMIYYFRKYSSGKFQIKQGATRSNQTIYCASEVFLPDINTLSQFHSKCVQIIEKKWSEEEFLEGFANDLVDAMKSVCDNSGSMMIQDFQMVNPCDIVVHLTPPWPYRFECHLLNNKANDLLLDLQIGGQIKLVRDEKIQDGCPCQSTDADDDMVCLLHCESEMKKTKTVKSGEGPLCFKNTFFLSRLRVMKWFQSTIRQAWAQISHKYEFELNIHYIDSPGALVLRFRSGKKISFCMNPVVRFHTDAYFFITPRSSKEMDTCWAFSLSIYEKQLFEYLSGRLPKNSCHNQILEIALFLHKRQMAFSGISALKASHFKMALMHLLVQTKPVQWEENCLVLRLRDLLSFIEKSLELKTLNHVLIGHPLGKVIGLPREITKTKPINLFHSLLVHDCIYRNATMHFQEMLGNANVLIHDYVQSTDITKF